MLKDLIDERVNFMYGDIREFQTTNKPDDLLNKHMTEEYYDAFEGILTRAGMFNIYSFEQIGLMDPYPDENVDTHFALPKTDEDLVYRGSRYVEGNSPNVLYFPSAIMLQKIMRACVGVHNVE
jgi:hypothetical protein